jgi:hypothetical protein
MMRRTNTAVAVPRVDEGVTDSEESRVPLHDKIRAALAMDLRIPDGSPACVGTRPRLVATSPPTTLPVLGK